MIVDGENGILVPSRNPKALANSISTLLHDQKLRLKLGTNARQLMVKKYDWNLVVQEVQKVHSEAIFEGLYRL